MTKETLCRMTLWTRIGEFSFLEHFSNWKSFQDVMSNNRFYYNVFYVESLSHGNFSKCKKYPGENKLYLLFVQKLFINYG